MIQDPLISGGILVLGIALGYFLRRLIAQQKANSVEQKLKLQLEESKTQAKEILIEAKDKAASLLEEVKAEERERKNQLNKLSDRILKKEESLEHQSRQTRTLENQLREEQAKLNNLKAEISEAREKSIKELQRFAGLSFDN